MFKLKNNQIKKIFFVFIATCVLFYEIKGFFFKKTDAIKTPRYLITNRNLEEGSLILALDFSLISNPQELPKMPITDQQLHFLKNARLLHSMKANEILSFDNLSLSSEVIGYGKNTPKGYSAYAIQYDNPLVVKTGENVDIYSTKPNSPSLLMIERALVLEGNRSNNQVVLALSSQSIQIYEQARQTSKITLAIQNPKEFKKSKTRLPNRVTIWEN